jgi:hypothetical protein
VATHGDGASAIVVVYFLCIGLAPPNDVMEDRVSATPAALLIFDITWLMTNPKWPVYHNHHQMQVIEKKEKSTSCDLRIFFVMISFK